MLEAKRLDGRFVYLRPIDEADRGALLSIFASDPENWKIQTVSALGDGFPGYWSSMVNTTNRITLGIVERSSDRLLGTSSFFLIDDANKTVEIGYTFLVPDARGGQTNPEAKLLMLDQAFSSGVLRVQFSVSEANKHSQAAMNKLGATREGLLRNHRITWNGTRRNTVVFSVIDSEWPDVRRRLLTRLYGSPVAG